MRGLRVDLKKMYKIKCVFFQESGLLPQYLLIILGSLVNVIGGFMWSLKKKKNRFWWWTRYLYELQHSWRSWSQAQLGFDDHVMIIVVWAFLTLHTISVSTVELNHDLFHHANNCESHKVSFQASELKLGCRCYRKIKLKPLSHALINWIPTEA